MRAVALVLAAGLFACDLFGVEYSDRYRSPRNPERKVRASTELIVLHTTEAPARSSLNKLSDRGEAHFCVTEEGTVYRIVDRDREAFHAGRSMWNAKEDVDKYSIGIECVGYHDKPMGMVQLKAIADLVRELKAMYRLSDDKVVSHCHVAYGAPNKWQKFKHRGRKRCGMLFAMNSVRRVLGLKAKPAGDADTRAKRLVVGDPYLNSVLYSGVDTMIANYKPVQAPVVPPPPPPSPSAPKTIAKVVPKAGAVTKSAPSKSILRPRAALPGTVGRRPAVVKTLPPPQSIGELKKRGYVAKGVVSQKQTAAKIAGGRWNAADTYYTIRNKVFSGKTINPARIEKGMTIWLKPQ